MEIPMSPSAEKIDCIHYMGMSSITDLVLQTLLFRNVKVGLEYHECFLFFFFFNNKNMGYLQILGPFCFTQFAYSKYPTEPWMLFWIFVVKWKLHFLLNTQFDSLRVTRVAKKSVISVTVHIEMRGGCPCSNWNLKSRDSKKRKALSQLGYACFVSECFG